MALKLWCCRCFKGIEPPSAYYSSRDLALKEACIVINCMDSNALECNCGT